MVFFPNAHARKDYLLSMIWSVLDGNQPKSWWLKFEALCRYFSKSDSKSVLNLPSKAAEVRCINFFSSHFPPSYLLFFVISPFNLPLLFPSLPAPPPHISLTLPPFQITEEKTEPALNILNTMLVVAKREVSVKSSGRVEPSTHFSCTRAAMGGAFHPF